MPQVKCPNKPQPILWYDHNMEQYNHNWLICETDIELVSLITELMQAGTYNSSYSMILAKRKSELISPTNVIKIYCWQILPMKNPNTAYR